MIEVASLPLMERDLAFFWGHKATTAPSGKRQEYVSREELYFLSLEFSLPLRIPQELCKKNQCGSRNGSFYYDSQTKTAESGQYFSADKEAGCWSLLDKCRLEFDIPHNKSFNNNFYKSTTTLPLSYSVPQLIQSKFHQDLMNHATRPA
jgi:hypothetical protein